ncbi:hypothetical protein A3862_00840 [Methylobacterium sp. XJLW]|uniref:ATP-binding protein n=1 Tax=Methylobacterium sp. XJLW TaxID=739141 RepID=UPI000DAB0430|nr:ATP-binding protein [Methylobacterium sp. XJLW]AWV14224.1 hypothetical protein A3862_00840 [Methylobacterium sp. XJLW]
MSDANSRSGDVLRGLLAAMSPTERETLDVVERVKARVMRTKARDGAVEAAFATQRRELVTRIDLARPLGPGNRSEVRALVLTGNTGAGKSSLLSRTISAVPGFEGFGVPKSGCPAISVLTPAPCNPKALGLELCRRLGYPLTAERSLPYVWATARDRMELHGIAVLHLDEIHSVLATANEKELTQLRMMLKTFLASPDWPVALLLSGLTEVIPFLEGPTELDDDDRPKPDTKGELRRRCLFVHLPSLTLPKDARRVTEAGNGPAAKKASDPEMVTVAVADMAGVAGMSLQADAVHALIPRLIHASLYELGTSLQIAQEAIALGHEASPRAKLLTAKQFKLAYRMRTACGDEMNPFHAADWLKIDCRLVLKQNRDEAEAVRIAREVA